MATVVNAPVWHILNCALLLGSECWWEGTRRACAGLSKKSCSFGWRAKHSLGKLSARFYSQQAFVPRCNLQPVSCRELGRWTMAPSCLLLKKAATQIGTYRVDSSACFTGLPQIPKQLTNPTQAETFTAGMAQAACKEFYVTPCGPFVFLVPSTTVVHVVPGWPSCSSSGQAANLGLRPHGQL